jgi:GNAT superfamily N-acetyltransferase
MENLIVRRGIENDLPSVLNLIKELALYEKAPHEVTNTVEKMREDGFGTNPVFGFFVAEISGIIIGISLYYTRYSTWKGRCLYLDDIVVTEQYRRKGIGKQLFDATLQHAKDNGFAHMNWQVLDWNHPAIEFYKKEKAELDGEWINCKIRIRD